MDSKRPAAVYIILVVIGILAGGAGVYLLKPSEPPPQRATPEGGAQKEKKILYWRAPMDPNYISDKPGKSPMGMDLIPVYEGEEGAAPPGTVSIDPVTAQNIGVRTQRVRRMPLTRDIRTAGRVDYDEKRVNHVNTKIEGWIEKLFVDTTGQAVGRDEMLLEIYSPKLVSTQEEYLLAKGFSEREKGRESGVPGSKAMLDNARRRLRLLDVPEHQIRELDATGRIMKTLHIHSPASGIIVKKNVQKGMFVDPGMNLYTIADISKVWVYADIYEYEMAWIREGQRADISLAAYPGKVFSGRVSFIYPYMEPKTRTVKVRIEVENPALLLKPDMYADITLKSPTERSVLAVPSEAVILSGQRSIVVLARGGGRFTPREVTLGVEAEGRYEVLGGLEAGDEVVTSAHFLIDSESRLKEAIAKMLDGKSAPAQPAPGTDMKGHDMEGPRGGDSRGDEEMKGHDMKGNEMKGMGHSGGDATDSGHAGHSM